MNVFAVPSLCPTLVHLIHVVWLCYVGPKPCQVRDRCSWSMCLLGLSMGSLCLTFSHWLLWRGRKVGVGLWPLALTFGLLSPASCGVSGGCGSSDTASALVLLSQCVLCERPSPWWGGLCHCCAVPTPPCVRVSFVGPSVVPLERLRLLLRCLRPSRGVSVNPGVLLGSLLWWCVCPVSGSLWGVEVVGEVCLFPSLLSLMGEALQGMGCGLCAGPGRADAPVLVLHLPVPQTPPTPS